MSNDKTLKACEKGTKVAGAGSVDLVDKPVRSRDAHDASRAEEFVEFLNQEEARVLGVQLPECVKYGILHAKTNDKDQTLKHLDAVNELLDSLDLSEEDRLGLFPSDSPEHIKKHTKLAVFNLKAWESLLKMALPRCGLSEARQERALCRTLSIIKYGVEQCNGRIEKNGYWDEIDEEEIVKKLEDAEKAVHKLKKRKIDPERKHWANEEEIESMWKDSLFLRDTLGVWEEVDPTEEVKELAHDPLESLLRVNPATCFPVTQMRKSTDHYGRTVFQRSVRMAVDKRAPNCLEVPCDKVRLLGITASAAIDAALMSSDLKCLRAGAVQNKKDVTADLDVQRSFLYADESPAEVKTRAANAIKAALADNNLDMLAAERRKVQCASHFEFSPVHVQKDFSKYYYQVSVSNKNRNFMAIAKPARLGGGWSYFRSSVCQFGSLSSVYGPLTLSEGVQAIVNTVLGLPGIVYIDDSRVACRPEVIDRASEVLGKLFRVLGLKESEDKEERDTIPEESDAAMQDFMTVEPVKFLGFSIRRFRDSIIYSLPPDKLLKTQEYLQTTRRRLECAKATVKDVQKAYGSYVFACSFDREARAAARPLAYLSAEESFKERIKERGVKLSAIKTIDRIIRLLPTIKRLRLWISRVPERIHNYTDASGSSLPLGPGSVVAEHDVRLGGFALTRDKVYFFSFIFLKMPVWFLAEKPGIDSFEILASEMLMLLLAQYLSPERLANGDFTVHVDNSPAVYALVKEDAKSPLLATLARNHSETLRENSRSSYITWVSSGRNLADVLTRDDRRQLFDEALRDKEKVEMVVGPEILGALWDKVATRFLCAL